mmetsp:Transcript_1020/g.1854  ORF Transcript_1020/g.1854 Transcript_1020/m.1854 type:complete len:162 (-) Transcript_1020:278-763(-)
MNNPNIIALQWRQKVNEEGESCGNPPVQVLKIGSSKKYVDDFIDLVVSRMKEMGVSYQKNVKKNMKISESEVSRDSVAQMDIRNVMTHIESYEEAVAGGDLNLNTIQTLVNVLYPKAIEYFSAFDNNMFNDLLNRMQSLLQRDDIQIVLNSVEAPKEVAPS